MVDVCVPAASVTDTVAVLDPVLWAVSGVNRTITVQADPGASVGPPLICPPPIGPQVDDTRVMVNSLALVPPRVP